MKRGLLDPKFRYTKSGDTDIRKLFARVKRQLAADAEAAKQQEPKVRAIRQTPRKEMK